MALIESAVCTKTKDGYKRSWKAFLEYTTTTTSDEVTLDITKCGMFGTTPSNGSGMNVENRTISLLVRSNTMRKPLSKKFNGSSYKINIYPNGVTNYENELPKVGSGGENNYDWTDECSFTFPRKASEYFVTIDYTVEVTSGRWTGERSVTQQVIAIPADPNAYVVPTNHTYKAKLDYEEEFDLEIEKGNSVSCVSTKLINLPYGEPFTLNFSNLVYVDEDGHTQNIEGQIEFTNFTYETKSFAVTVETGTTFPPVKVYALTCQYSSFFRISNDSFLDTVNFDDLKFTVYEEHEGGEAVDEANVGDVMVSSDGIIYTLGEDGWVVSVDDAVRATIETVTLFSEINFEKVVSIANAFHDCTNLETANIPTSVQDTTGAFENCEKLTGYYLIPDTVTEFDGMFDGTVEPIFVEGAHATEIAESMPNTRTPEWTFTHTVTGDAPDLLSNGRARADVYVLNTVTNQYDLIPSPNGWGVELGTGEWTITVTVGKNYVADPTEVTTTASVRVEYQNITTDETSQQKAFFSTTRNLNYHTGLANNVFVSGTDFVDYTSRVWYSYVDNPLYFPDDKFIEVGSNDKHVMGLTKVGQYLGVVKQGASKETAIYLAYATSFDDETAFAVKQSISGVGALAKYSFNVLNDEALFLSPNGIVAIEEMEDDQHKVKDRGYFINGGLLSEPNLEDAYSIVWNGWYLLAVNDHIYVLDGNQRNSWGNDRTNLVYEGYVLTGVSVNNFVTCMGNLWFSTEDSLCRFKNKDDLDPYTDNGEPVKARWSTVFDDDGAINFYKTMRKKGNVVSILPEISKNTKVYVRKDNLEPKEIERDFSENEHIPNELFINKKFKKYKRLQFIIENEAAESFGVDSITKQYTIGNYAKK